MGHASAADRAELVARLRRIEGQIRGIQRMLDQDVYCIDVLTQVSAVVAGMNKVGLKLMTEHVRGCISEAGEENRDEKVDELVKVVTRFVS